VGYGDVLMTAGLAERLVAADPAAGPVTLVDCTAAKIRWHPLWQGNPAITTDGRRPLPSGAGCLPYLVYPRVDHRLQFSPTYRAADVRGHLYLTEEEHARAMALTADIGPFLLIEPFPQDRKNVNRQWALSSWRELIAILQREQSLPLFQCAHESSTILPPLGQLPTPTFRDACAVMARARLVIALEGGIPFATAALDVPTVVLWGGCISADVLAYPEHVNLVDPHPETPCGQLRPCPHCTDAWARWTPRRVADRVLAALREES
jgi:hypothetical protein